MLYGGISRKASEISCSIDNCMLVNAEQQGNTSVQKNLLEEIRHLMCWGLSEKPLIFDTGMVRFTGHGTRMEKNC
jgi:hypothetical protein